MFFFIFLSFSKQSQTIVGWINFGFSNVVYEVRMLYTNSVPWFANKMATQVTLTSHKMLGMNARFFFISFYYYDNIEARKISHGRTVLFLVVSYFFFITIIASGLPTGDRPPARGACASAEAVTSYFLSYIFFFFNNPCEFPPYTTGARWIIYGHAKRVRIGNLSFARESTYHHNII